MEEEKFSEGSQCFYMDELCSISFSSYYAGTGKVHYYLKGPNEKTYIAFREELTSLEEIVNGSLIELLRE